MLAAAADLGLSSGLLQAGLGFSSAGEAAHVWLHVAPCAHNAQRFYRRWGFRRAGMTELAVGGETITAVVMTRPFAAPEASAAAPDLPDTRLL
jgi:hypothetical protein